MTAQPWDREEVAWARECLAAGDTLEEIADMSGRTLGDVEARLGRIRLTPMQREVLSLYAAGLTYAEIDTLRGRAAPKRGKHGAAASLIVSRMRHEKRLPVPYRQPGCA